MKTLNLSQPAEDCTPLYLPVRGLYADYDAGCGSISLPDEFNGIEAIAQAEVLQDWLRALELERRHVLVKAFRDMSEQSKCLSIGERIAAFRKTCAQSGIEFPPDLAVLLQYD